MSRPVDLDVSPEGMLLTDRVALVTGAAQGIGEACAVALARFGAHVAICDRDAEGLATTAAAIDALGRRVVSAELDVRDADAVDAFLATVEAEYGHVDVLVNNAGVPLRKPALELTANEWDAVIGVNLTGTFFMSQQMGRYLVKSGRAGCIINIASTHGLVALDQRSAYGIAKAAIMHMTRMLAIEWADHGIRVNAVAPGRVDTPSRAGALAEPGYRDRALGRIPLQRFGTPEEVAGAVRYLASPDAAYITGQTLVLDGGLTAQ